MIHLIHTGQRHHKVDYKNVDALNKNKIKNKDDH